MKRKSYTTDDLIEAVKTSKSYAQVIKKLGLVQAGGTQKSVKAYIEELKLDISHFHFEFWNRDKKLKENNEYKHYKYLRHHIIKERGGKCEECGLNDWRGKSLPLEIHHRDRNRKNNSNENLQVLCPNCHSLTDGYRRRKGDYLLKQSNGKIVVDKLDRLCNMAV